ncbi:hypothetical protein [Mesorhizobium marinum]|uniref:hypothetical protein n=1 Tax=Mesorhizobium marinum TaxID=3228790 RepID=UPI0034657CEB
MTLGPLVAILPSRSNATWGVALQKIILVSALLALAGCAPSETGAVKAGTWTTVNGQPAQLLGERDGRCIYAGKHNTTFEAACR